MTKNILIIIFLLLFPAFFIQNAYAEKKEVKPGVEGPLNELKAELLSYFQPVTGKIISAEGKTVKINIGSKQSAKTGMRLNAFKEGVGFIHPVTKETLGRIELPVGLVEITQANADDSTGVIISGKPEDFSDAKVKVPGTKIKVLFCQGNVEWYAGDFYYQMLKESGRLDMKDTGIETDDDKKLLAEAGTKGAEAVVILSSGESAGRIEIRQRLLWVNSPRQFSEKKVSADIAYADELKIRAGAFGPKEGDILLSYQLSSSIKHIAMADLEGKGSPDIIMASDDHIMAYRLGPELKLLFDFKVPSSGQVLWLDTLDIDRNGRDEILITSMNNNDITSYIYELKGAEFVQIWKSKDIFIRKLGNSLAGQKYIKGEGYSEDPFYVVQSGGTFRPGEKIRLPKGVNIYDFQFINHTDGRQSVLAWDEIGYLSLYDDKGLNTWSSKEDFGGFTTVFKKDTPTVMVERGAWSVKDRLIVKNSEVFAPKRKPLAGMARGLGYKGSEIRSIIPAGGIAEERVLIEEIGGEVLDYAFAGDRVLVVAKPLFGLSPLKIFKGESPLGSVLYIFSLKGR